MTKLTVELVPETCWFSNVRSHVSKETWDILRKYSYQKANYHCQICGGKGEKHPVECHEIWDYDDAKKIQKLRGLISLCPSCHQVKHLGLARINGKEQAAKQHLAKVNGWSVQQVEDYLMQVWELWRERSQYQWQLDLSLLEEEFGLAVEYKR